MHGCMHHNIKTYSRVNFIVSNICYGYQEANCGIAYRGTASGSHWQHVQHIVVTAQHSTAQCLLRFTDGL